MTFINFAGAILFWFLAYFCLLANEPLQSYNSAYQTICESVQQFWRRPTSWYRSFGFQTSRLQQPHRCTFDLAQAIGAARSQVRGQRLLLVTFSIFALIFLLIQSTTPAVVRGEGFIISMDGEGAILELASLVAKEHGEGPKTVLGPSSYAKPTVKRSYRRAVRRAMQCGYTWYRGRLFTTSSRSASVCSPSESHVTASTPTVQPSKRHQRQRMLCLTWNSGGLAQAGILCMVSKRLCQVVGSGQFVHNGRRQSGWTTSVADKFMLTKLPKRFMHYLTFSCAVPLELNMYHCWYP